MFINKIRRKIGGASMVEFALGSGVFLSIIFGMISFSLAISSKILLIRAADFISMDAITNTDLRLDTRNSGVGTSTLNSYLAARDNIKLEG